MGTCVIRKQVMSTFKSCQVIVSLLVFQNMYFFEVNGSVLPVSNDADDSGSEALSLVDLPPECTEDYRKMKKHTMCLKDRDGLFKVGLTEEEKKFVLDLHNQLRAHVEPPAANMMKMVWDDKIAAIAQKWAKQCKGGHDSNRRVPSYRNVWVGQNTGSGYLSWRDVIMGWYNESRFFAYGQDYKDFAKIGHYTQVVQAHSSKLGCGYARCGPTNGDGFYICNYAIGQGNIKRPYEKSVNGTEAGRCSKCPHSCSNGLCDCGGKVCQNGGALDIDTCTCKCAQIYKGEFCERLECPAKDDMDCWSYWPKEACIYSSVWPICPHMCGRCGDTEQSKPPPVTVSRYNCTYKGHQATAEQCATYGNKGEDNEACSSAGGSMFDCRMCNAWTKTKTLYCPVMCGFCKGYCNGLVCTNKGKLNRETCKCECQGFWTGERCEKRNCDYKDIEWKCGPNWGVDQCKYFTVSSQCPHMCGLCP